MCGDTRMHDLSLRGQMCVCSGGGWREGVQGRNLKCQKVKIPCFDTPAS